MAGVSAARELVAAGLSVCVVEGRDRVGGRVHSVRDFCDEPVEAGAEFVHGVGAATWPELRAAGLEVRPCPLMRHTLFNVGGGTRWLPWILMHPGVWPCFTILREIGRFASPDISAREFVERRGYRGRARILAEMTLSAHLPGNIDEIGMQGLLEDGVLKLETGTVIDQLTTTGGQRIFTTLTYKGWAHAPASTAQLSGMLQLVMPNQVTTNLALGSSDKMASAMVMVLRFVPEPGLLLLLGAGATGLAALGRRRIGS